METLSNQNKTLDEDKNYVDNKTITENGMDGKALENTLRQCNSAVEAFKDANDKYKLAGNDNDNIFFLSTKRVLPLKDVRNQLRIVILIYLDTLLFSSP